MGQVPKYQMATEAEVKVAKLRTLADEIDSWAAVQEQAERDKNAAQARRDAAQKKLDSMQGPNIHRGDFLEDNLRAEIRTAALDVQRFDDMMMAATRNIDRIQAQYDAST